MENKTFKFKKSQDLYDIDTSLDSSQTLLQVFLSFVDLHYIEQIQKILKEKFPNSFIIGCTTDGVIYEDDYFDDFSVISITKFKHTYLKKSFKDFSDYLGNFYEIGKILASEIIQEDTKAIISLAEGINFNGEDFVRGVSSVKRDVVLAGGMAGDNGNFIATYVFDENNISSKGVVGVSLNSKILQVSNNYNFDWTPIGKEMVVNKSVKNIVYEIDGISAYDIYAKYLGNDLAQQLPKTGIEFPLIFKKENKYIGRAVIGKDENGALIFAGNLKEGTKVRFGVGNAELILRDANYNAIDSINRLKYKPKAIFSYSCMARKMFLGDYLKGELAVLNNIAKLSGFFTYGEFFHMNSQNELLNETMTVLFLSECEEEFTNKTVDTTKHIQKKEISTVHVLANLANVVSTELETLNKNLEQKVKESSEFIYKQAYFDKLTGLPNRLSLMRRLEERVGSVILLINIDDFTSVNDFYGHIVGDEVIKKLAQILKDYAKEEKAELFKLPSDEFAMILKIPYKYNLVEEKIKEIIHLVENSNIIINDISIYITVSMSASLINVEGNGLASADMSLKIAKKNNKPYMIYDNDINLIKKYENNLLMANIIKNAIDNSNIIPYFQPIYDIKNNKIVKYEALVRLKDENSKIYSPYSFLELSQKIKLYPKITQMMIEKTFEKFADTNKEVSINLAFEDILNDKIKNYLFEMIDKYNIASKLTIEILETQVLEEENEITEFLKEIKNKGVQVAIDDFGSGFANFEYLAKMNADFIKIDGSLVKNINKDKDAKIVVETVVGFAKKVDKTTVAEFVHSKEILDIVKEMGVDLVQGYYLGEPKEDI